MPEITETFVAADREIWRSWLAAHGPEDREVWLLIAKKGTEAQTVAYDEAVEEALCFGWIDGHTKRYDETYYAVRFSPRKPGSVWAESNVARAEKMIRRGRMTDAGMLLVDEAKRRGTWDEAASGRPDVTPPDLEEALAAKPQAAERWRTLGAVAPAPVHLLGARCEAARDPDPTDRGSRPPRGGCAQAGRAGLTDERAGLTMSEPG